MPEEGDVGSSVASTRSPARSVTPSVGVDAVDGLGEVPAVPVVLDGVVPGAVGLRVELAAAVPGAFAEAVAPGVDEAPGVLRVAGRGGVAAVPPGVRAAFGELLGEGLGVGLGVGLGFDVAVGEGCAAAGGGVLGGAPAPKAQPSTLPGAGLDEPAPVLL